jgi:hypothetical protein
VTRLGGGDAVAAVRAAVAATTGHSPEVLRFDADLDDLGIRRAAVPEIERRAAAALGVEVPVPSEARTLQAIVDALTRGPEPRRLPLEGKVASWPRSERPWS